MKFDGKKFAEEIIAKLPKKEAKLAIFLDSNNISGAKYVEKKIEAGKQLGVEFLIYTSPQPSPKLGEGDPAKLEGEVLRLNNDPTVTGIMIQLPFPNSQELINLIDPEKDVDGLREGSLYLPAAVLAVQKVLSAQCSVLRDKKICVVGARGFVGRKLMQVYPNAVGMDKEDFDPEKIKDFDVVISATGQAGLIKEVKTGAICVDLGFPKGDFSPEVALKASFFTPVPGGVGPVTVACLFENLFCQNVPVKK